MQLRPKSWTWAVTTIYQEGTIGCHNYLRICMKNKSIYEQALKEVHQETVGLDWSSINAVVKLKRGQDSVDSYHIYKVNDKKWNSRPTFVMKSSRLSTETALKMDTRNKKSSIDRMCCVHGRSSLPHKGLYNPDIVGRKSHS